MKKILIILLAIFIGLFFVACPGTPDGGDAGDGGDGGDGGDPGTDEVYADFTDDTTWSDGDVPSDPWEVGIAPSSGTGKDPAVVNNQGTFYLEMMEDRLGDNQGDWGVGLTGYSYLHREITTDGYGYIKLTAAHYGWVSGAHQETPNYIFEAFLDLDIADIADPGTADWTSTGLYDDTNLFEAANLFEIPDAGTYTITLRAEKDESTGEEDSVRIAILEFVGGDMP
jgi:hypothetical protein